MRGGRSPHCPEATFPERRSHEGREEDGGESRRDEHHQLEACGRSENDPLWRMPLWRGYEPTLESKIADVRNVSTGGFAGSITAALFLSKFVSTAKSWTHFDVYTWTPTAKPGRPEGGECQAARALYALLKRRYGS